MSGIKALLSYAGYYIGWLLSIGLSGLGFALLRAALNQWYVALNLSPYVYRSVDRLFLFFGGVAWIALIFVVEGYLRKGAEVEQLGRRFIRVVVYEGLFILVAALLMWSVALYL